MAKITSSFKCILCEENLHFPQNIDITEFTILFLQFYKAHGACEKAEERLKAKQQATAPDNVKTMKRGKNADRPTKP